MNRFIFLSLLMFVWQAMPAQCTAPVVTASGPTTFCPGGSVTLSTPVVGNTWTQKANFGGVARESAVGFSIGNKGYIGTGGQSVNGPFYKDFWEYDPATNAWTQKANFGGVERDGATGFSIGNRGHIGTGYHYAELKDFWEYNPAANTWTKKADFPGTGRFSATAISINNNGYIGMGAATGTTLTFFKDFWEYNAATDTWTKKADFGGSARYNAPGFSIGNKGYVGTGNDNNVKSDFWEYNPATNTWIQKADFGGSARYISTGFNIGNKGYIGLGFDSRGTFFRDFWEYNPVTNTWVQKADFGGSARWEAPGFSISSKGYVGTGQDYGGIHNDFWEFDPGNSYSWSPGGQATSSITRSTAGSYSVTATNVFGCSATSATTTVTVKPTTQIVTQPKSTSVCESSSVSFSVAATGSNLIYQWYKDGQSSPYSNGTATLTINNALVSDAGSYTVVVTGDCGTVTSTAATLTVDSKPVLTIPGNITTGSGQNTCGATVNFAATANGSPTPSIAYTVSGTPVSSPYTFPPGTTTVTAVATNTCGSDSKTFTVTVEDKTAPTFTVPANRNVSLGAACSVTIPDLTAGLSGSDNCGAVGFSQSPVAGTVIASGHNQTHVVTITANDGHGNTTSQDVILTAKDNTLPTITAPAAITVSTDAGGCSASNTALGTPTYTDCSSVTVGNDAPAIFPKGITTVTWTATDAAGNKATATQSVTVTDNEKPVITCPVAPATLCYNSSGTYTIAPLQASDNCGTASTTYAITGATTRSGNGINASGIFAPGTSIITWTVKDAGGNTATCQTTVTVNSLLTVSIPDAKVLSNGVDANTVYPGYTPAATITLSAGVSGGSGSYGYKWSTGATTASIRVSPTTATTYTVTVTDVKGCTGTASKGVKVTDVRCGNKLNKVSVCHGGNTLCIDQSSVPDHLGHGDYLGTCDAGSRITTLTLPLTELSIPQKAVSVYPNPSNGQFTVQLNNSTAAKAEVQIVDAKGVIIERKLMQLIKGSQTLQFNLANKASGMYLVKVIDEKGIQSVKMIVQR